MARDRHHAGHRAYSAPAEGPPRDTRLHMEGVAHAEVSQDRTEFEKGKRYPWTYWGVSSARRRDWPKAGIKANFHDLRRTGAEYMRAAGVPIDVYSKQLGHSDIKTTQIYMGDLSPEQLAGSAIQRDAWLEAVNAKIEAELAEEAAARSNPTKNPTTGRGAKRKQLKLR